MDRMNSTWNPWKLTAIAMALVMTTALVTGLVVANWSGSASEKQPEAKQEASARPNERAPRSISPAPAQPAVPMQTAIATCNEQAAAAAGQQNKTTEVVKDAAVGAVIGAAVGAAGGAIADGGKGAGKGAAIGGVAGAGGGTLYGLNQAKKHDEAYRTAYSSCMRAKGYSS